MNTGERNRRTTERCHGSDEQRLYDVKVFSCCPFTGLIVLQRWEVEARKLGRDSIAGLWTVYTLRPHFIEFRLDPPGAGCQRPTRSFHGGDDASREVAPVTVWKLAASMLGNAAYSRRNHVALMRASCHLDFAADAEHAEHADILDVALLSFNDLPMGEISIPNSGHSVAVPDVASIP